MTIQISIDPGFILGSKFLWIVYQWQGCDNFITIFLKLLETFYFMSRDVSRDSCFFLQRKAFEIFLAVCGWGLRCRIGLW